MRLLGIAAVIPLICGACDFHDGPNITPYNPPSYQWGTVDSESDVFATAVAVDDSGNAYVAGYTKNQGAFEEAQGQGYMFVTGFSGVSPQWTRQWGKWRFDRATALVYDPAGYLYVAGMSDRYTDTNDQTIEDSAMTLSRLTLDGVVDWTVRWNRADAILGSHDAAYAMVRDERGNLSLAGVSEINDPFSEGGSTVEYAAVATFAPDGTLLWESVWGRYGNAVALAIAVDPDGARYVAGYTDGAVEGQTANGGEDVFVTKLNTDGTPLWHHQIGTELDERGVAIAIGKDGSVWVTDLLMTFDRYGKDTPVGRLIHLSTQGVMLYESSSHSPDYALAVDSTGNVFTFGNSNTYLDWGEQLVDIDHDYEVMEGPLLLAKWKGDGTFVGGVEWGAGYPGIKTAVPAALAIHDNTIYAVGSVTGEYALPVNSTECWQERSCALLSMISLDK